jgi:hypothetical protein
VASGGNKPELDSVEMVHSDTMPVVVLPYGIRMVPIGDMMGLGRWFFYGTDLPSDKQARRNIDRGEEKGIIQKAVAKGEDATAARKARAAGKKRK